MEARSFSLPVAIFLLVLASLLVSVPAFPATYVLDRSDGAAQAAGYRVSHAYAAAGSCTGQTAPFPSSTTSRVTVR